MCVCARSHLQFFSGRKLAEILCVELITNYNSNCYVCELGHRLCAAEAEDWRRRRLR